MKDLAGKVAIVTGSSKGIGAAIAERLASDGASVVVNYSRNAAPADALVERITSGGGKAIAVQADLSKSAEIAKLFSETKNAFGRLDILVNNAGIYKFLPLEAIDEEHIDKHFNLNVKALLLATKAAVPLFGPEGGVVINISSGVSSHTRSGQLCLQWNQGRCRRDHPRPRHGARSKEDPRGRNCAGRHRYRGSRGNGRDGRSNGKLRHLSYAPRTSRQT